MLIIKSKKKSIFNTSKLVYVEFFFLDKVMTVYFTLPTPHSKVKNLFFSQQISHQASGRKIIH
jgi:hypothetical protein